MLVSGLQKRPSPAPPELAHKTNGVEQQRKSEARKRQNLSRITQRSNIKGLVCNYTYKDIEGVRVTLLPSKGLASATPPGISPSYCSQGWLRAPCPGYLLRSCQPRRNSRPSKFPGFQVDDRAPWNAECGSARATRRWLGTWGHPLRGPVESTGTDAYFPSPAAH